MGTEFRGAEAEGAEAEVQFSLAMASLAKLVAELKRLHTDCHDSSGLPETLNLATAKLMQTHLMIHSHPHTQSSPTFKPKPNSGGTMKKWEHYTHSSQM